MTETCITKLNNFDSFYSIQNKMVRGVVYLDVISIDKQKELR